MCNLWQNCLSTGEGTFCLSQRLLTWVVNYEATGLIVMLSIRVISHRILVFALLVIACIVARFLSILFLNGQASTSV